MAWALLMAAQLILVGVPFGIMLDRAGLNPLFAFLVVIPIGGIPCVLAVLAFSEWPVFTDRWEK